MREQSVKQSSHNIASFFTTATRLSNKIVEFPGVGRDDLAEFFAQKGYVNGVELGVEQGKYAEVLCKAQEKYKNDDYVLHCVDAWQAYRGYRDHVGQEKLDGFLAATQDRLHNYKARFHRQFSVDAAKNFADRSLDYIYIDANHNLISVITDLVTWAPKVKVGGIISGHDYCRRKQSGYQVHVVEAVEAYVSAYFIDQYYLIGSKEVRDGETRDRPRSYMWVNR